ncbi:MarR family winged helix-turn-helix transcriptional regulator [Oceanobacillus sp. FSL H7-0719]|uniref:MarR family winged helix-turn-helix transcriptional regulator n=1 Tax=Oceanobacillus sp. FSL H7-0719 TaxID=2954507 RepID=UPI003252601B
MEEKQLDLNIFDLLSRKQILAHKTMENRWNEQSNIQISHSEWVIIDRLYEGGEQTIAEVSKIVEITRQGTHKLINKLEENLLVVTGKVESNKRNKYVKLTDLGMACYERNKALKGILEHQIQHVLGTEQFYKLKEVLADDWGL